MRHVIETRDIGQTISRILGIRLRDDTVCELISKFIYLPVIGPAPYHYDLDGGCDDILGLESGTDIYDIVESVLGIVIDDETADALLDSISHILDKVSEINDDQSMFFLPIIDDTRIVIVPTNIYEFRFADRYGS